MLAREARLLRYVRASEQDEAKMRQFLGQFPSDYTRLDYSRYLKAPIGGVYLALTDESEVVGVAVAVSGGPQEIYLTGIRIAAGTDGQEICKGLTDAQMEDAAQRGVAVVRALIEEDNEIPLHTLQDGYSCLAKVMWEVGEYAQVAAPPPSPSAEAGPAWAVDQERIFGFLANHPHQLWAGEDLWFPRPLSDKDLEQGFEVGGAAVWPQDVERPVQGLALYQVKNHERLDIRYLKADSPAVLDALLDYVLVEAHAWGVTQLRYGLNGEEAQAVRDKYGNPSGAVWRAWMLDHIVKASSVIP